MTLTPISIANANAYVARWHRHHKPTRGALFALSVIVTGEVEPCGVAIVGRPVARRLQDGRTCEVLRIATDGTRNACSRLLHACRRAAQALGYVRVITYTLASESGASLRAVGATISGTVQGRSWDQPSRPRTDKSSAQLADKVRWELLPRGAAC
jgi:hypothetical protein